jgi:hypothetical protein
MSDDLVLLAEQYLKTAAQLEAIRRSMSKLLANGSGGDPEPLHPPMRPERPGAKRPRASKPPQPLNRYAEKMAASAAAYEGIVVLLKNSPEGMKSKQIAEAMGVKASTTAERLRKLAQRGLVERSGGGWSATSQG